MSKKTSKTAAHCRISFSFETLGKNVYCGEHEAVPFLGRRKCRPAARPFALASGGEGPFGGVRA